MGLGSQEQRRRTYYLSPRAKTDKVLDPHFAVKMRDLDGTMKNLPNEPSVSGYLVGLGTGEFEWPKNSGKKLKTIKIFLMDGDDLYQIEANRDSNLVRSMMNTILGTRDFDVMRIALSAKNENAQVYINNNGNKTNWKFEWDKDVKPLLYTVEDPKEEGKMITVYKKYDQLLWDEWTKLIPYVNERAQKLGYTQGPSTASVAKPGEPSRPKAADVTPATLQQEFDEQPDPRQTAPVDTHEPYKEEGDEMPF
jgi:hypothetical protein